MFDAFPPKLINNLIKHKWRWVIVSSEIPLDESEYFGDGMEYGEAFCDFAQMELCFKEEHFFNNYSKESVVFHEMGHAIYHSLLTDEDTAYVNVLRDNGSEHLDRIVQTLGKDILCVGYLVDPEEYFAESTFLFLTTVKVKLPLWKDIHHSLSDIFRSEDPSMYHFIESIFSRYE